MNLQQPTPHSGFLRERQLRPNILPVAHSTLWRMVAEGRFPKPIKLSERVTVWRAEEVAAWVAAQGHAASVG
jgi:predicted DNA-binding transcriptional regulator AlpA